MKRAAWEFLSGIIFALGLGLSGMTRPGKVTGFLDFLGDWDPSLMFVMLGAILVYSVGYHFFFKKKDPPKKIDPALLAGAAVFGAGWGLAGFCPGPAIVSLATLRMDVIFFVGAMMTGIILYRLTFKRT